MNHKQKIHLAHLMGMNAGIHQHLSDDERLPQTPMVKAALDHLESAHTLLNAELNTEIEPE